MQKTSPIIDNQTLIRIMASKGLGVVPYAETKKVVDNIKQLKPMPSQHRLIRVGPEGDGGYLVPDDLEGIKYCFSPGVSDIAGFEEQLHKDWGIFSFLADHSVNAPPRELKTCDFEKKFIHSRCGDQYTSLESWVSAKLPEGHSNDLILQMDIEGAEYDAIISCSDSLLGRFRIIVLELHWLDQMVFDRLDFFGSVFRKLTKQHQVVHLHPNNCCASITVNGIEIPRVLEVSLLRRDRIISAVEPTAYPHMLDSKNILSKPDLILPKAWYLAK